jgi:lysophospholipase L1-like esterase
MRARIGYLALGTVAVLGVAAGALPALAGARDASSPPRAAQAWTGSWAAAPAGADVANPDGFAGRSVRNVIHLSVGGTAVRVHLTNAFGSQPLALSAATVALADVPNTAAARPGTVYRLRFGGRVDPVVPVGAEAVSDPVGLRAPAGGELLVTTYLTAGAAPTFHPDAQQVSYVADGDHTRDTAGTAYSTTVQSWYYLDEVDVRGPAPGSIVALGDSITDGFQSTVGANHRWPDYLADRLNRRDRGALGVLNEGISANKVLLDPSPAGGVGPGAVSRVQRDVLARSGVRSVVLLEGINDIDDPPQQTDVTRIESGLQQIAAQVHAAGLPILVGTLTPYAGSPVYTAARDREREALNHWIRTTHVFDGVIDFDRALRDPGDPHRLRPVYDSGDHLHPSDAGYRVMAATVPLGRL